MRRRWASASVAAGVLLAAVAASSAEQPPTRFAFADPPATHPLVGKLFDGTHLIDASVGGGLGAPGTPTLNSTLGKAVACGTVTVLGEVHDNPIHHRWRAWLIEAARKGADRPADCNPRGIAAGGGAAVFEHIRADKQPALDSFAGDSANQGSRVTALLSLLGWDTSGWPEQALFVPLFAAVLDLGLPIYAGDPSREMIRAVAKNGLDALPQDERRRLALDGELPDGQMEALLEQLEESHCGLMPKTAFGNLALAQRYRDATLADATLRAAAAHGSAVLLTGNGHARTDRGAPWYLRQRAPDMRVVAVALLEVEDGKTDPMEYLPRDPAGRPAVDYVLFTTPTERPDPCEEMRKRFKPRQG